MIVAVNHAGEKAEHGNGKDDLPGSNGGGKYVYANERIWDRLDYR